MPMGNVAVPVASGVGHAAKRRCNSERTSGRAKAYVRADAPLVLLACAAAACVPPAGVVTRERRRARLRALPSSPAHSHRGMHGTTNARMRAHNAAHPRVADNRARVPFPRARCVSRALPRLPRV